ncbi:hypothetical protein [Brevundimonas sp.]|uniref:hypothetical protein n=1 Tax=Brevundimonas sp. TaxID=1871086 RepID=UPI001D664D48|nr:hypothetical protein [Brevundimonas sp.]MBL0946831.1 hypothetical protein [Brevundimonas sp.]
MLRPRFKSSAGIAVRRHPHGHLQYLAGSLHADLSMAISLRVGAEVPASLFAGLLSRGADPDGHGYEEVVAAGYLRQTVGLAPAGLTRMAVPHPVTFEASQPLLATHIAIFSAVSEGELLWSGALRGVRYERQPSSRVYLPAFMLTVAKPPTPRTRS